MAVVTADEIISAVCGRVRAATRTADAGGMSADRVGQAVDEIAPLLTGAQRHAVLTGALARLTGLGALERHLADRSVTEVVVNAGREVWVDRSGRMERAGTLAPGEAEAVVERVLSPLGLRFDRLSPVVDARLADGARLCAVMPPLAVDGLCLAIRRFALPDIALSAFAAPAVEQLVRQLVTARCNIVVSGATSTGKTTLLNVLAGLADPAERIITIEDTAELRLHSRHVVRLEARRATPDGVGEVSVRDLVRTALRLRPDRLVVGEVRGPEAYDMVQALNTGHDGSLSTVHANSPLDALRRLCSLAAQGAPGMAMSLVAEQVVSSIDVVAHLARRADGGRSIVEVAEVVRPGTGELAVLPLAAGSEVLGPCTRQRSTVTADADMARTR